MTPEEEIAMIAPVKFIARAEMIAIALKTYSVPLDHLTARILRGMAQEIEQRVP